MATNLFSFPQQSGGGGGKSALVEFRAGKCTFSNKKVTPDKRKGLVQLTQSHDGLIHFVWKDRTTGAVEDDLIIFPEEATFKRVKQITGRVYMLEFKASSKRHFFWLQEPKEDKDEENCNKINEHINNPPNPEQGAATGGGLGGLDQNALFQMFGGRPGASAAAAASSGQTAQPSASTGAAASQASPSVGVSDLQNILSGMGMPASTLNNMFQQQGQRPAQTQPQGPSLSQIVSADNVLPLIMGNQQLLNQLLPLLPEERRTPEEIQQVLRSPQFQQSLETFSQALQSGQLTDLIRQFNIQTSGGPQSIENFLQSLQNQSSGSSNANANANAPPSNPQGDQKKDKDDDKMDTQ
eukprot:TRINITY_DN1040_c0_g1_i2.p1 TRINITY_DN1040_c0_g1~~TRINITY_DN1040_c0_g1_i2.p1  ORF type:complete len:353 (+),score=102.91 TRINITY_DN1040_c0_g1_i2:189-1247(+)